MRTTGGRKSGSALAVTADPEISALVRSGWRRIAWLLAEGSSCRALKLSNSSIVQAGSMPLSRRTSGFSRNPRGRRHYVSRDGKGVDLGGCWSPGSSPGMIAREH